jgi:hypothetical protein
MCVFVCGRRITRQKIALIERVQRSFTKKLPVQLSSNDRLSSLGAERHRTKDLIPACKMIFGLTGINAGNHFSFADSGQDTM